MLNLKAIGLRIKEARDAIGMTQVQLADRLKVSKSTVTNWENAVRTMGVDDLDAVAQVLGKTPAWFFGMQQDQQSPATLERATQYLERLARLGTSLPPLSDEPTPQELAALYPRLSEDKRLAMWYMEKAVPMGWEPGQARLIADDEFDYIANLIQMSAGVLRKK